MDNQNKEPQIMAIDDTIVGFWLNDINEENGTIDITYSILDGPKIEDALLEKHISTAINEALRIGIEKAEYDRKTNI